jgi:hypothetical protein
VTPIYLNGAEQVAYLNGIQRQPIINGQAVTPGTVTPPPSTTPAPGAGTVIWRDDFNGPAGSAPDPASWTMLNGATDGMMAGSPGRDSNVFLDGAGNLIAQVRREPTPYTAGGHTANYSGSFFGTYAYGTGWPVSGARKRVGTVPFAFEARIKYDPVLPGGWGLWWGTAVNKNNTSQGVVELDWNEERLALPTTYGVHQHFFSNGADIGVWDGQRSGVDLRNTWHTVRVEVRTDLKPRYFVDGALIGTGLLIRDQLNGTMTGPLQTDLQVGILGSFTLASPGTWGAGGGSTAGVNQPDPADPGPWRAICDWVQIIDLT